MVKEENRSKTEKGQNIVWKRSEKERVTILQHLPKQSRFFKCVLAYICGASQRGLFLSERVTAAHTCTDAGRSKNCQKTAGRGINQDCKKTALWVMASALDTRPYASAPLS